MFRVIFQPTGDWTKDDFIENDKKNFAEDIKYRSIWESSVGDLVLLVKNKTVFAIVEVSNLDEYDDLTIKHQLGYSWNNTEFVDIPLEDINKIIGYKENFTPNNYMLIKEENINEVLEFLNSFKLKLYTEDEDTKYQNDIQKIKLPNNTKSKDDPAPKKSLVQKNGKFLYPRSPLNALTALKNANYKCEINIKHNTFISKVSKENYVEAHHLIPLSFYQEFDISLDVPSNIISLCPNCHRMVHLGNSNEINKILTFLYEKRADRLKRAGIHITVEDLQYFYKSEV